MIRIGVNEQGDRRLGLPVLFIGAKYFDLFKRQSGAAVCLRIKQSIKTRFLTCYKDAATEHEPILMFLRAPACLHRIS